MAPCRPEKKDNQNQSPCACKAAPKKSLKPDFPVAGDDTAACCEGHPPEPCSPHEKPGFQLWGFVEDFLETPAGPVPRVRTELVRQDWLGTVSARLGIGRDQYRIAPGLYGIGTPDTDSPVLVTASYKLSFDALRSSLPGVSAWILVVETRGINVWCAAGKGTFSTQEVAGRVKTTSLEKIVTHRRLILPQLCATGVAARRVKSLCGFTVVWGPVHARHIKAFLDNDMKATPAMRKVTFSFRERVELIPVELNQLGKPTLYLLPVLFVVSGLGPGFFSIRTAISRGAVALLAYLLAVTAGAILVPVLLPWLPGRAFALKGAGLGAAAGALLAAGVSGQLALAEMVALTFFIMAVSSYLAMNFTGSTPFTSPTGVEKEMRRAIPLQAASFLAAVILWVGTGFAVG